MSKKTIFLLTIFLIALTDIFAQENKHKDLEYIFRDKPIYKVETQTYLRQNDFSESAIKAQIPKGSKVIVINSYFRERWEVLYKGERGWLDRSYLSFYQPGMKNISETNTLDSLYSNQPIYYVKSETFLKEHMSHQSATLATVPKGVKVRVINSLFQEWWEVLYDNRRGNLQKSLLSYQEISMPQEQEKKPEPTLVQIAQPEQIQEKGAEPKPKPESEPEPKPESEPESESISEQEETKEQTQEMEQEETQMISTINPDPPINAIKYSKKVIKATSLRKDSSSKSKVILRFKAGSEVSVIDDESNKWWAKVIYKEKIGWVKKSLLKD